MKPGTMDIITLSRDKTIFLSTQVLCGDKNSEVIKPLHKWWLFFYRICIGLKKVKCPTCGKICDDTLS